MGANAVGMSIPPPAITESRVDSEARDRSPIKHFFVILEIHYWLKLRTPIMVNINKLRKEFIFEF